MIVPISPFNRDCSHSCCRWPWVNIDIARIMLLGLFLVLYLFFGAAVFSALERPSELEAHERWNKKLADFEQEHSVSLEDLHVLLKDYEEANSAGVWVHGQTTFWDFPGALCFVATVISTIGYGLAAPTTTFGRIFLIFFGLIGCAAAILFFNLFLERIITLIAYTLSKCHEQKFRNSKQSVATSHLTTQPGGTASGQKGWKPSVSHATLILVVVCLLLGCAASGVYSAVEGWNYWESIYFCFVTFTTMGFGDMVSGQREYFKASWYYQIANILAIFFGVCCTYSLSNLIAIMMKGMLNWILDKVLFLNCRSETMCLNVEESYSQQLSNTSSCFSQHWSCHVVKLSKDECKCAGSAIQTVCQSEMHVTEVNVICKEVSRHNLTENSLHVTSDCSLCQDNSLPIGGISIINDYM
ncbi:potassium channel subfamily K member 13 [Clarias gariepinus]